MSQNISLFRYPEYLFDSYDWSKWRTIYEGGETFTDTYLKKFSLRETADDYVLRKSITPTQTFAASAVDRIRNSIFLRMTEVVRKGGSQNYQNAIEGKNGGVDLRGAGMNMFWGFDTLQELLVMGRCGIYVDMPNVNAQTLADEGGLRPYLYRYPVEDILAWTESPPGEESAYQVVLLRDKIKSYGSLSNYGSQLPVTLPMGTVERYRLVFICPITKHVMVQFYNTDGEPIDQYTNEVTVDGPRELELTKIPFIMLDIKGSLLKNVSQHQIALLNLGSSDVAYALKANYPFYTEQRDSRAIGSHLKHSQNADKTGAAGDQGGSDTDYSVGPTQGRFYGPGMERPEFINPSPEPLEASMKLQAKLEDDINKLVNSAVANKTGKLTTSETDIKDLDPSGIEAGLAAIGSVLQNGERQVAEFWANYENRSPSKRQIATIAYPGRYSLKTDLTKLQEAKELDELTHSIPGRTAKKELAKLKATTLLTGKVTVSTMEQIYSEIDSAPYTTSDPDIIMRCKENGVCGDETAAKAMGFLDDEYLKGQADHAARAQRIAEAQSKGKLTNAGARGVPDLSDNPNQDAREEKELSRDSDLNDDPSKPVRGNADA